MRHPQHRTAVVMALGSLVLAACGDAESSMTAESSRTTAEVATQSSMRGPAPTPTSADNDGRS
jgi:uncharacterized lipoprotein YehR (DUF1307 family)